MKKRHFLLTASAALLLAACGNELTGDTNTESNASDTGSSAPAESESQAATPDLELSETLDIAYAQNNRNTLTYNQATPITMPDGSVISQGDLKPVWQYMGEELGIQFRDTALQDSSGAEYIDLQATTGFTEADVYSGAMNSSFMRYGQEGYFVDLSTRLNDMPNVKAFLEENPTVQSSITAPDGGIYFLPYVQELDYQAMVFFSRPDWVEALLDSTDQLEDESETVSVVYEGYWDERHDKNVVDLQNEAASNGTLDRDTALTVLLDYIKETYPDLEKPSDLYNGETAQHDIDELVALWRVIKMSPNTLSKVTTGEVVEGAVTTPMFFQSSRDNHTNYFLRLANYFGGQIIYGVDGGTNFYLDADGELTFSMNEPTALDAFENLRELWQEGLFYQELSNENNDDNFRQRLFASDEDPENKQFGFMTLDWIGSTSAANQKAKAMLPPVTTLRNDDEFVHYIGGMRPLNNFGAAVSAAATEQEVNSALTLFDYLFSEEGARVFNYGTPDMWSMKDPFVGPDGIEYPKLNDWVFESSEAYSNGELLVFLKEFIGSTLQTAYLKSIGVEYQFTPENGLEAFDLYADVLRPSYSSTDPLFTVMPNVWPINEQQQARLDNTNIGTDQRVATKLYIMNASAGPSTKEELADMYEQGNIDTYIQVYTEVYESMQ